MCGIAGVWSADPIAEPAPLATRIDDALAHRGPDGHAWTLADEGRLLLVHRRLAIIDPTPAGAQPMSTPDGRHTIIFNGEIYNHQELRAGLEREGHRFATRSDTEVLLRLVSSRGAASLDAVRGMFAFALWDARDRTLTVARDRFGIKPCYVASQHGRVAVASEIGALRAAGFAREVRPAAILAFLRWGSIPAPMTWAQDVDALEPGTWHRWSAAGRTCGRFADVRQFWSGSTEMSDEELRQRTHAALSASVRAHLLADVPVGLFLSGGVDSAALLATAAEGATRLHTFTVTVDQASHDEAPYARGLAARFGTEHHTLRVDADAVLSHARRFLHYIDQPTIDGVNTFFVSGAVASTGIKAVLSGIGGDELFGGYPSFRRVLRATRFRRVPGRCASRRVASARTVRRHGVA
jgi:asparagine synthase (glutamine-hydrolysing)